jgi:hypothetical protein
MKNPKALSLLVLGIATAFLASAAQADVPYKVADPNLAAYFGHISLVDIKNDGQDPAVLRAGKNVPEVVALNFPIGPGDTILTFPGRRLEIQFDTGTIIRLDYDTELKIETLMAQTLSAPDQTTNLVLSKGQVYVMFRQYSSSELFQLMTGNSAVKLDHGTVAKVKVLDDGQTEVQVKAGKASVMYGLSAKSVETKKVRKLEALVVLKDSHSRPGTYGADTEFDRWNEEVNANFLALHKGQSLLPKPVMRFSPAVTYFAQKYSNIYGEWVWDDLFGYVWRPNTNDYYPWGTWQPLVYGQWTDVQGQMFWVPEEIWGWIPYHLGTWTWDKKLGWLWIPGSAFAPAWATWDFFFGSYAWRPWSFADWWMATDAENFFSSWYWNNYYGFGMWPYGWITDVSGPGTPPPSGGGTGKLPVTKVSKGQLVQPKHVLALPKDMKSVYKNVLEALRRGDERVTSSFLRINQSTVFVKPGDIGAPRLNEKAVRFEQVAPPGGPMSFRDQFYQQVRTQNPARQAAADFGRSMDTRAPRTVQPNFVVPLVSRPVSVPDGPLNSTAVPSEGRGIRSAGPAVRESMRFRDWNPDIRAALERGLTISYSSLTNEVRCPQLGISSRDIVMQREHGGYPSSGHGYGTFDAGGSGSSSSSTSSSSTSSSHGTSETSSHGTTGTVVKKD